MAEITAAMVKALRDETSQGMMECKKALQETGGDVESAKTLLRKQGMVTAEKKSSRDTAEGLIAIKVADDGQSATIVEVKCETDFCARNDLFKSMVANVIDLAHEKAEGQIQADEAIAQAIQAVLAKIGENMSFARGVKICAPLIGTYLHHNNKVGVLLGIEGEVDAETLSGLCMHIAFADPMGLTVDDIPADLIEKERQFSIDQALESGKPKEIVEKMIEGKMRKFTAARALLEQPYVRDEKRKIGEVLGDATIKAFARFSVGG